ncbi:MAG: phage holin family protein [Burkholderiales bacterium]|nr:phage holin family protein [Burkholderiales bacterium]
MHLDTSGSAAASGTEGFLTHIRQLGASLLGHAAMRVELLSIEVQEEKARLVRLAISAALVSALLIVSLVMMAILVLAIYWDTPYRVTAALWLVGTFTAFTIGGGLYLSSQLSESSTLFTTSAGELRRDADALTPQVNPT